MWASPSAASADEPSDPMMKRFEEWMVEYGRVYKDNDEKMRRFQIFKNNVNHIETFNSRNKNSYTLGINQFTDMTNNEFVAQYTGGISRPLNIEREPVVSFDDVDISAVPQSIDWRDYGAHFSADNHCVITTAVSSPYIVADAVVDADANGDAANAAATDAATFLLITTIIISSSNTISVNSNTIIIIISSSSSNQFL
ncbi:ananain-like [Ananas comosus]|uniref:Ananain-like n=1 Tax=Ananas comosus TaxID=4615 RepID=A0A6P5F4G7_ANACO|nr:ananain-like [Ananas comosus]